MQRSLKQNSSLHVLFQELGNTFNDAGLDMRVVMKPDADIPWDSKGVNVKEKLWYPFMVAITGKHHTSELTSQEIDKIYDVFMKHISERFGIFVDFPSNEEDNKK